jgi:hypothetical protein
MEHRRDEDLAQDEYLERLLLSLRVRNVPSEQIRDILDEVSTHLDASGEDPVGAFGTTSDLADALVDARPIASDHRMHPLSMAAIAVGSFVAALLVFSGAVAIVRGEPVTITVGTLAGIVAGLGVIAAALPLTFAWLDSRRGPWAPVGLWTAWLIAFVVLAGILTTPVVAERPGWVAVVAGGVCVAAVEFLTRAETRRARARGAGPIPAADRSWSQGPSGTERALRRAEARLPTRVLESPRVRLAVVVTVIVVGVLGALAVAVNA